MSPMGAGSAVDDETSATGFQRFPDGLRDGHENLYRTVQAFKQPVLGIGRIAAFHSLPFFELVPRLARDQ